MKHLTPPTQLKSSSTLFVPQPPPLLQLPANELLEKFGAGKSEPGCGSAAALMGVLSCKLLRTVITLTRSKKSYEEKLEQLTLVNRNLIDEIEPNLIHLFQVDSERFSRVILVRNERKLSQDAKVRKRLAAKERRRLKLATESPLSIAKNCIFLAEHSLGVFDLGYKSARGDSCVAASAAVSATIGALSVVYLNLQKFKNGKWSQSQRNQANKLMQKAIELQSELLKRISMLDGKNTDTASVILN